MFNFGLNGYTYFATIMTEKHFLLRWGICSGSVTPEGIFSYLTTTGKM